MTPNSRNKGTTVCKGLPGKFQKRFSYVVHTGFKKGLISRAWACRVFKEVLQSDFKVPAINGLYIYMGYIHGVCNMVL